MTARAGAGEKKSTGQSYIITTVRAAAGFAELAQPR